ncbi:MAG: transporter substrate-binding domain-containing protein [Candidatus Adiutrix sp.]|jgi:polar amino acid transport system substrate-binding protein|nr:transporter substrate-binding domain-containing protein [Candidatus Adiutrix sp.]
MLKHWLSYLAVLAISLIAATLASAQMGLPAANQADAMMLEGNPWVERIQAKGTLRVGMDIFRPWAMQAKSGQYIGFEIQVAEALAADMGVKVEFVPTAWDGIIPALLTGRFDILIGSMGITEERAKRVAFTEPYQFSGMALAASVVAAPGLKKLEDFNKKDFRIAIKSGTTAVPAARKHLPLATIVEFDDEGQTAQELRSGRAQALVASAPYPAELALKNPKEIYLPFSGTFTREPCGMALSPRDKEALPALNAWIAARFKSQWLNTTWSFWFETLEWEGQLE